MPRADPGGVSCRRRSLAWGRWCTGQMLRRYGAASRRWRGGSVSRLAWVWNQYLTAGGKPAAAASFPWTVRRGPAGVIVDAWNGLPVLSAAGEPVTNPLDQPRRSYPGPLHRNPLLSRLPALRWRRAGAAGHRGAAGRHAGAAIPALPHPPAASTAPSPCWSTAATCVVTEVDGAYRLEPPGAMVGQLPVTAAVENRRGGRPNWATFRSQLGYVSLPTGLRFAPNWATLRSQLGYASLPTGLRFGAFGQQRRATPGGPMVFLSLLLSLVLRARERATLTGSHARFSRRGENTMTTTEVLDRFAHWRSASSRPCSRTAATSAATAASGSGWAACRSCWGRAAGASGAVRAAASPNPSPCPSWHPSVFWGRRAGEVLSMLRGGMRQADVAREVGVSPNSLWWFVRRTMKWSDDFITGRDRAA